MGIAHHVSIKMKSNKKMDSESIQNFPTPPDEVPKMYQAQVQGRCSLQYFNNPSDLFNWTKEWIIPDSHNNQKPYYQHQEPKLGLDGSIYRLKITFPFRVFSNCGQDSILRPVLGKNGIPFFPGSGIKGLFRQLLDNDQVNSENKEKIEKYCGSQTQAGTLRFHGAYPIGDWAGTTPPDANHYSQKNHYKIVDICHPQQGKQVEKQQGSSAIALISLYKPTLIFELSSTESLSEEEWKRIEGLLKRALRLGLGGKNSTGYGLCFIPQDKYPIQIRLKGQGVSSLLPSKKPEFRPNIFKATLRGHVRRLLGGVNSDWGKIEERINHLFGSTRSPGLLDIYWNSLQEKIDDIGKEKTPTYEVEGDLYLDIRGGQSNKKIKKDLEFIQQVLRFSLIMGGVGKSWRRVWHETFYPAYKTRAIGCHWHCLYDEFIDIKSREELTEFLNHLYQQCQQYLGIQSPQSQNWREAWHPSRVKVYSQVVQQSRIIDLFHDNRFKNTKQIGGRETFKDKKGKEKTTLHVSYVWHRMLPLPEGGYLEIVTLFSHEGNFNDQVRQNFICELQKRGLTLTWGG